jgi:hypothetical protein
LANEGEDFKKFYFLFSTNEVEDFKNSFNRVFKDVTEKSPSEFKESALM